MNIETSGSRGPAPRDEKTIRLEMEEAKARIRALNEKARRTSVSDEEVKEEEDKIEKLEAELRGNAPVNDSPTFDDYLNSTVSEGPASEEPAAVQEPEAEPQEGGLESIESLRAKFQEERRRRTDEAPVSEGPLGDFPPIVVPGVNPDRVKFADRPEEVEVEVEPARIDVSSKEVRRWGRPAFEWAKNTRAGTWFRRTTLALFAGGLIATNVGTEYERGQDSPTAVAERVADELDTTDMETMATQIQNQVCQHIDTDFMHRLTMPDAQGEETFNPGVFAIPFSVAVTERCTAKVDVNFRIPYDFARTFKEIVVTHPERRAELVQKLTDFITKEVRGRLVVSGIAGVTGSHFVYDRDHGPIDFGKLDISNITTSGTASAEAERSTQQAGPASLMGDNPENAALAQDRLTDTLPLLKEAFAKAGVSMDAIKNIKEVSYEKDLVQSQVRELAAIARAVFGESVESDTEMAYQLVQELNAGNPVVRRAVEQNPEFAAKIKEYITDSRGVEVSFTAETTQDKTTVYNAFMPWPLFLLLFGFPKVSFPNAINETIRRERSYPAVMRKELVNMPKAVARRIFSETTPPNLQADRSFNDRYDAVDLSERPKDTRLLLEHMLIEEVLPSLYEETKEPMIDYEEIVAAAREYMRSDARKNEVQKGSYPTTEEAERKVTELLINMWEQHDATILPAATLPMGGIDIKEVLNYRHSSHIIYWAKTLSQHLVSLAKGTTTPEEFRTELQRSIAEFSKQRVEEGRSNRNFYVRSEAPLG